MLITHHCFLVALLSHYLFYLIYYIMYNHARIMINQCSMYVQSRRGDCHDCEELEFQVYVVLVLERHMYSSTPLMFGPVHFYTKTTHFLRKLFRITRSSQTVQVIKINLEKFGESTYSTYPKFRSVK